MLASRIGVMNQGRIVQVGTPHDIYEFPNSRFVADFIGSANMFEGKLLEDAPDHVRIACAELDCTLYADHGISAASRATVWAAIRPEKIEIASTQAEEKENSARGVVQDIAYLGDTSIYLVRIHSGKVIRVTQPNVRRHEESITREQSVYLRWHPSSLVVVAE